MSAFDVDVELSPLQSDNWRNFTLLVDTGSTYTWIPGNALQAMGITPQFEQEFETADGRIVRRDVAIAQARIVDTIRHTMVVFAGETDSALLGVVTLEEFSLGLDPVNERLIPVRGLAMGA